MKPQPAGDSTSMTDSFFRCALIASACALVGCVADPKEVVESEEAGGGEAGSGEGGAGTAGEEGGAETAGEEGGAETAGEEGGGETGAGSDTGGEGEGEGMAELEPLEGMRSDGPPVFEVTVEAAIDPPYDLALEGDPVSDSVWLFHCGAVVFTEEDEVRVPEGTVDTQDVGAVLIADYESFADQDLRLGGGGPFTLSLVYDAEGEAVYSESGTWGDEAGPALGVFPRALDPSTELFEITPGEPHVLTLLDPTADYDASTQTLTTQYEFQSENGQEHSITETYRFSGRHLAASQSEAFGCD